jgi:hypothetical protein
MVRIIALLVGLITIACVSAADAGLTTPACLAQKRKAWADLRKCQAAAAVLGLKGKSADLAKCTDTHDTKLTKIDAKATNAAIRCRLADNGDGTVIDYDTGLQWEMKTGSFPAQGSPGVCFLNDPHCVNDVYDWPHALVFVAGLNGTSVNAEDPFDPFDGLNDWRLPASNEIPRIITQGNNAPPHRPDLRRNRAGPWTDTTITGASSLAWTGEFASAVLQSAPKTESHYVRAVRTAF